MRTLVPSRLLKAALLIDAAGSGTMALLQLLETARLEGATRLAAPLLTGTGAFFVGYVAVLLLMARASRLPLPLVVAVVVGNVGWALGCAAFMALNAGALTGAGLGYVAFQLVGVLLFAALQYRGLATSAASAPAASTVWRGA